MASGTWKQRANEIAVRMRGMPFEDVHRALCEIRDASEFEPVRLMASDEDLEPAARTIAAGGNWRWR